MRRQSPNPVYHYSSHDAVFVIDAATGLIAQIANLVMGHKDHSNDHRELELELKNLHRILDLIEARRFKSTTVKTMGLKSLANTIVPEVERCRMLLRER